jgi:hypothetical protein
MFTSISEECAASIFRVQRAVCGRSHTNLRKGEGSALSESRRMAKEWETRKRAIFKSADGSE